MYRPIGQDTSRTPRVPPSVQLWTGKLVSITRKLWKQIPEHPIMSGSVKTGPSFPSVFGTVRDGGSVRGLCLDVDGSSSSKKRIKCTSTEYFCYSVIYQSSLSISTHKCVKSKYTNLYVSVLKEFSRQLSKLKSSRLMYKPSSWYTCYYCSC